MCTAFVESVCSGLALWLADDSYWALTNSAFDFTWFETAARFAIGLGPYFTVVSWGTVRINTDAWFCCNSFGANNRCRLGVVYWLGVVCCCNVLWYALTDWAAAVVINDYPTVTCWARRLSKFTALVLIAFTIVGTATLVNLLDFGILIVLTFGRFKVAYYVGALDWSASCYCTTWIRSLLCAELLSLLA